MVRALAVIFLLSSILMWVSGEKKPSYPFFSYDDVESLKRTANLLRRK